MVQHPAQTSRAPRKFGSPLGLGVGGALLLLALLALVAYARASRKAPPPRVEAIGSFSILTHEIRFTRGWNEGKLSRGTTEQYSIAWRGAPFRFTGMAGLFTDEKREYDRVNAAITFPAAEPAIVVNVGDPNNRSFFYLLREVNGKAEAQLLGETWGSISADWIDAPNEAGPRQQAVHRKHLEGGRYLLLGDETVLDTKSLRAFPAKRPAGISLAGHRGPLALSSDGHSFVRIGFDDANELRLVVFDVLEGRSEAIEVDPVSMRYFDPEAIDAAWIDHHFEWRSEGAAHARLVRRQSFTKLPYRGRLTTEPSDGYREYRLQPVKEEMQAAMVAFLRETLKGELLPRAQYSTADVLSVGGRKVNVMFGGEHLGVWMDRGTDSSLMIEIAAKFDEALASGRYDSMFAR